MVCAFELVDRCIPQSGRRYLQALRFSKIIPGAGAEQRWNFYVRQMSVTRDGTIVRRIQGVGEAVRYQVVLAGDNCA